MENYMKEIFHSGKELPGGICIDMVKINQEPSLFAPASGTPYNVPSNIEDNIVRVADTVFDRSQSGRRRLFWNKRRQAIWLETHADNRNSEKTDKLFNMLIGISGVNHVDIDTNNGPRGDGWIQIWPERKP